MEEVFIDKDQSAPRPAKAGRVEWIDTLKGILIFLVVLGHVELPLVGDVLVVSETFELIYLFHMPLFIFVSGFLSKRTIGPDGRLKVNRIVGYYVLGLVFNLLIRLAAGQSVTILRLLSMPSAPWYLVAMASWMLLVPVFSRLRPSHGMLAAIAVSVLASLSSVQTDGLALSRTLHFLPYFYAGYYLSASSLERLRAPRVRVALVTLAVLAAGGYLLFRDGIHPFMSFVYGNNECTMALSRALPGLLLITALGVVLSLGCIAAAPSACAPLAILGERTFQVYVIHRFLREWAYRGGLYEPLAGLDPVVVFAVFLAVSVMVCVASSWSGFKRVAEALLSIRWVSSAA